jgi:N-acetylglucosamine-6-phosphate deacetylase
LVTDRPEALLRQTALLAALAEVGELTGIHLEGPFLSAARCGAQDPAKMLAPDPGLVTAVAAVAKGFFATMTVAPELPGIISSAGDGALSVIEALASVGAVPSFGHTDCTAEQLGSAVQAARLALARASSAGVAAVGAGPVGAVVADSVLAGSASGADDDGIGQVRAGAARSPRPTATHLFNGMRPIHHRQPGPVLECLAQAAGGDMAVELVADGVHLDPRTVADVFKLAAPGAVLLVTDAMAAAGMADGAYQLGPMAVTVTDGVARLTDGGAIAGGTAHLIDVVRSTVRASRVPLAAAVRAASSTPAGVLGIAGEVGSLAAGLRADLLLTDAGLTPVRVYRAGNLVA